MSDVPDRIAGRYETLEVLGAGAAAVVLRCRDLELQREVAVKLLSAAGPVADPQRFLAEARALAQLRHRHIIEVFDYGVPAGERPYLVLEIAPGGSLMERCPEDGLPPERAVEYARGLLDALAFAHGRGILHRDLKLENVLVAADEVPKLSDFGLAKFQGSGVHTRSGIIFGTPEYMAPEVMEGAPASPASDLYSFGCLLHHMVNGRPPHMGELAEIYRARSSGMYEAGKATGLVELAIRRCLEVSPKDRAPAEEVAALLAGKSPARAAAEQARAVGGSQIPEGSSGERSRGRGPAIAAGLLVASLLGFGVYRSRAPGGTAPPPPPATSSPLAPSTNEDIRTVTSAWRERIRELDVAGTIARLHRETYGDPEGQEAERFQHAMLEARTAREAPPEVGILDAALGSLPLRAELDAARTDLAVALSDPKIPYPQRRDLFEVLQELAAIDTYAVAWGLDAPYGAGSILRVLAPARTSDLEPRHERILDADGGLLRPGHTELFRWEHRWDRDWPLLIPSWEEKSERQNLGWGFIIAASGGRWDPQEHRAIRRAFRVDLRGAEVDLVRLLIRARNLVLPNSLRLTWNSTLIDLYPSPRVSRLARYDAENAEPFTIEVDLPPDSLREHNQLELRARVLPGLRPINSLDVISVTLRLDAR